MVTISICKTAKDLRKFERIPELIHKNHPWYTPPFPGSVTKLIGKKSPFLKKASIVPMIAYRDGQPVGRVAAIVNHSYLNYRNNKVGFFGFFDSIDDSEVAKALLSQVKSHLQAQGVEQIRGPYSPSIHDECGVLVEGFDSIPFVMMPYNPPYYERLLLEQGFYPQNELYAFYIEGAAGVPDRIIKICNRAKERLGVTIRSINMKNLKSELKIIHELYNQTLDRNSDFYPITLEDIEATASDLKAIANPDLILIAEKDGAAIGYSLSLPNINEFLWNARNSPRWLRVLRVVASMFLRSPKEARLIALGVKPEYRNKGIAPLFYYETMMRGRLKYRAGELSWCEASNKEIINAIEMMQGKRYKTYRIYEMGLA